MGINELIWGLELFELRVVRGLYISSI